MVLAIPGSVVAVLLQYLGKGPGALRHEGVVAGEARTQLHNNACGSAVVVAPAQQCGARGRAERGGVKVVVAQPVRPQPIHCRRRNLPTERA